MDIAAVQALGREEKREFSWKEGRKGGRRRNREGAREGRGRCHPPQGDRGAGASTSGSRTKAKVWDTPRKHSWETPVGKHGWTAGVLNLVRAMAARGNPEKPGATGMHICIHFAYHLRGWALP